MDNWQIKTEEEIMSAIGIFFRKKRLEKNMKRTELAREAEIGLTTINSLENGRPTNFESLLRAARVLGFLNDLSCAFDARKVSNIQGLRVKGKTKKP